MRFLVVLVVTPERLVLYGLFGVLGVAILHFVVNLLFALSKMSGATTEEELETLMTPALEGVTEELPARVAAAFGWGAIVALLVGLIGLGWWVVEWLFI